MTTWTSTTDRLPDDGICVLIVTEDREVWTGFIDGDQWRYVSADPVGLKVIYWMDFPEPPK